MDVHKVLARLIGEIAWFKGPEGNTMTCRGAGVDPLDFDGAHDAVLLRSTSGRSRSSTPPTEEHQRRDRDHDLGDSLQYEHKAGAVVRSPSASDRDDKPGPRPNVVAERAGRGARSSAVRAVAWGRYGLPRAAAVVAGGVGGGWVGGGWVTTGGGAGRGAGAGAGAGAGCGAGAGVGAGAVVGAATG